MKAFVCEHEYKHGSGSPSRHQGDPTEESRSNAIISHDYVNVCLIHIMYV